MITLGLFASMGAVTTVSAIPFDNTAGGAATATVGAAGDYTSFKAACDAFNAVTGDINRPWTMEILESLTEPNLVSIANTFGSGGSLTIKPAATTAPTVEFTYTTPAPGGFFGHFVIGSNSIAAVPVADADIPDTTGKYIIDGSNAVSGTTRDLTFAAGPTTAIASSVSRLVRVVGRTKGVTIKNTNFIFNDTGGSAPCIGLGAGTVGATAFSPDDLLVENCSFISGQIAGSGGNCFGIDSSTASNGALPVGTGISGVIIRDNDFTVNQRGIFMNGFSNATIERNNITITNSSTATATQGIFHFSSNQATGYTMTIDRNVISTSSASNTAGNGAFGITIDNGGNMFAGTHIITNNIIKGAFVTDLTPLDAPARGININPNAGDVMVVEHNSILVPASSATGVTATKVAGITVPAVTFTGSLAIRNNIVRVEESDGTAPAIFLASAANVTSEGNDLSVTGLVFGRAASVDYADLATWVTGTGLDATGGSQSVNPNLTTPAWDANLHFSAQPVGLGVVAASTTLVDVDGEARPATGAYPGADEPPLPAAVGTWQLYSE